MIFLILIIGLLIIQDFLLLLVFRADPILAQKETPKVTLMIAVRNESANMEPLIQSLKALDYPVDRLQILIGDDRSEDDTWQKLKELTAGDDRFTCYEIAPLYPLNGKANVLAQLSVYARGDYYLYTDADCRPNAQWVRQMLAQLMNKNAALISGITTVSSGGYYGHLQNLDWLLTLGMVKAITRLGLPVTAMGNNMAITQNAYQQVGGFATQPFSLTEDFELMHQVKSKKGSIDLIINAATHIYTHPIADLKGLLQQRKRWMTGAVKLPFLLVFLLGLQVAFFPAVVALICNHMTLGVFAWMIKLSIQSLFIQKVARSAEQRVSFWHFLFYEIYYLSLSIATVVYFILPIKTYWKGKSYK
ncbi:glycosyltransferase family 2 protein [Penaeicola halotolerans]|uniref:glycosyltransferase family 2 protein n=1 Tax=Penaeicola halotolerans TaxID=2793196 RepID=UPI001CF7FD7C|nr:glycosyltransferase family 2 protein [Penaeicola halotolerans]